MEFQAAGVMLAWDSGLDTKTSNDRHTKQQHSWQLVHPQKCNPHLGFGSRKMERMFREKKKKKRKGNKMIGRG